MARCYWSQRFTLRTFIKDNKVPFFIFIFLIFVWVYVMLKLCLATLIVWNEPDPSVDLALSFQESEGCQDVWYVYIDIL